MNKTPIIIVLFLIIFAIFFTYVVITRYPNQDMVGEIRREDSSNALKNVIMWKLWRGSKYMKLSPQIVIQIKAKCSCGFDFEPWKDDATHEVSHGICAMCYMEYVEIEGLTFKQGPYDRTLARMAKALRWGV